MKTIHDFLPKYVMPEYRVCEGGEKMTIGLVDIRDGCDGSGYRPYMDCETFPVLLDLREDTTTKQVETFAMKYFSMLFLNGVLTEEE